MVKTKFAAGLLALLLLSCLVQGALSYVVRVVVVDLGGERVSGASVVLINATGEETWFNTTDGGEAVFNVTGGKYKVNVTYQGVPVAYSEIDVRGNTTITIMANVTDVLVVANDTLGRSVDHLRIDVLSRKGELLAYIYTNETGECELENLVLGNYTLNATRGGVHVGTYKLNLTGIHPPVVFTCGVYGINVSVLDSKGKPLEAEIRIYDEETAQLVYESYGSSSRAEGLVVGKYLVEARKGSLYSYEEVLLDGDKACEVRCPWANLALKVRVVGAYGPLSGLEVILRGPFSASKVTDADGFVSFEGLLAGDYLIEVKSGGNVLSKANVHLSEDREISIELPGVIAAWGGFVFTQTHLASVVAVALLVVAVLLVEYREKVFLKLRSALKKAKLLKK